MNKLMQMRNGIDKLIRFNKDVGTITRKVMIDNGRGNLIPANETSTHNVICRVSEADALWRATPWTGGLAIDTGPSVLAYYDADLQKDDLLEWRGRKYTVGAVTRPEFQGGVTCVQAPLVEVKNG